MNPRPPRSRAPDQEDGPATPSPGSFTSVKRGLRPMTIPPPDPNESGETETEGQGDGKMPSPQPLLMEQMTVTRQYKVISAVGRGGCGVVYRAELVGPGGFTKTVALKALHPDVSASSEMARRLRDEGRMLGMVKHPAIVNADGLVLLRDRWTIVMEFVEGPTLKELLRSGPLPATVAFSVAEIIAEALDFAYHTQGPEGSPLRLVHRDIKPSNIKITPLGEVKILDFGLARADFDSREADSTQQQFMSVPYMAPERLEGASSAACDVYSLGSVLFEMLTGSPLGRSYGNPARHTEHLDACRQRCDNSGLHESTTNELMKLLSHNPDERPLMSEVERWCHRQRVASEGPDLREWSRTRIPRDISRAVDVDDTLIGRILEEAPTDRETGQWSLVDLRRATTEETTRGSSPKAQPRKASPDTALTAPKTLLALLLGFGLGTAAVLLLAYLLMDYLV